MHQPLLLILVSILFVACGNENDQSNMDSTSSVSPKSEAAAIEKGQVLFNSNCKVCHSLDKTMPTGMAPVLESIKKHWPDHSVLGRYIKNAPEMMQENERSRKMYQEWKGKAQMPPFTGLNNQEIDNIILFLYKNT